MEHLWQLSFFVTVVFTFAALWQYRAPDRAIVFIASLGVLGEMAYFYVPGFRAVAICLNVVFLIHVGEHWIRSVAQERRVRARMLNFPSR